MLPRCSPRSLSIGAALLALSSLATAQTLRFGASFDGLEAGTPSTGSGSALVTLDTATGAVTLTGNFTGLTSNCNNAHIHGPAPRGTPAGIVLGLSFPMAPSGTLSGSGTMTPAQMNDLIGGLHYVNVHSVMFGGGEIRGQLDLIPSTDCPAQSATDPVLGDFGGTPFLGPNINDPLEPFGSSLDCSGAAAPGVYAIQLRPNKLAVPAGTGLGDLWITGPKLATFSGPHSMNVVTAGPIMLPNDMALVGLSYGVQGFCGGRLSNALQEHIGLP